jgi:phosphoribosyl-AMP cyclohydrolase
VIDPGMLRFDADGLIPAVVQESVTGNVVLLAFMNAEAIERTFATREAYFWSRSRRKLWRKGESSGHVLSVEQVLVNCECNSLLLRVSLAGPGACHEGYRTCFYREIQPDGALHIIAEQAFDPSEVYDDTNRYQLQDAAAERDAAALYAGYERLRDEDYTEVSRTARMLRDPEITPAFLLGRADQELSELQGVLDGTHVHSGGEADVLLESSQVFYWIVLAAVYARVSYDTLQPEKWLLAAWHRQTSPIAIGEVAVEASSRLWQLGILLREAGVHPAVPLERDLADLRKRLGE